VKSAPAKSSPPVKTNADGTKQFKSKIPIRKTGVTQPQRRLDQAKKKVVEVESDNESIHESEDSESGSGSESGSESESEREEEEEEEEETPTDNFNSAR
jgi:hypothetical protein